MNEDFWIAIRLGRSRTFSIREKDLRARGEATVVVKEEAAPAEAPQEEQTEAPAETATEETTTDTTSQIGEADLASQDTNEEEEASHGGS